MDNQKFLNISKKPEVSSKFILILVIIVFIIVGGMFAYEYWWIPRQKASLIKSETEKEKRIELEIGTTEKEEWGVTKEIKE